LHKIKPINRKKKSSLSPVLHTHSDEFSATAIFCSIIAADQHQSVLAKRSNKVFIQIYALLVEVGARLIQQEHWCVREECLRQLHPLLHARAEVPDLFLFGLGKAYFLYDACCIPALDKRLE
jgi:hypothetical protein